MSINHFSSDIPDTIWWTHQQPQPILMEHPSSSSSLAPPNPSSPWYHPIYPTAHRFNLNQNDEDDYDDDYHNARPPLEDQTTTTEIPTSQEGADEEAKEHMFEKPLTPSDVGKLNRLVIPKQHAERYFPLGGDSSESKGLLLSFEDETGKCWRFRYSYWNSSQSYVLTKGWSRYVKEKRLDAGDVVLFERHKGDAQRLFIGWRRRQQSGSTPAHVSRPVIGDSNNSGNGMGVAVGWTRSFYPAHPYPAHHQPLPYQPSADCLHAGIYISMSLLTLHIHILLILSFPAIFLLFYFKYTRCSSKLQYISTFYYVIQKYYLLWFYCTSCTFGINHFFQIMLCTILPFFFF